MAVKQVNAVEITIRIPLPLTYPLEARATIEWEVQGLAEVNGGHRYITGSIPSAGTTVGAILSVIKSQLETILQTEGSGGHTVVDRS